MCQLSLDELVWEKLVSDSYSSDILGPKPHPWKAHFTNWNAVIVQSLSHVWLFMTSWTAAHQDSLYLTFSQSLSEIKSFESVILSKLLILSHPLLLLLSTFSKDQCLFSSVKVVRTLTTPSASVFTVNQQSWFTLGLTHLLSAVQENLTSPPEESSKIINSLLFWHQYTSNGKTIDEKPWASIGKIMSLLFNTISWFVIASLLRINSLLNLWLPSWFAVNL